jgi:flagellar motor switch protein FliM
MQEEADVKSMLGDAVEGGAQRRVLDAMDERGTDIALAMKRAIPFLMRRSVPLEPEPSKIGVARALQEELEGPIYSVPLVTDPGGSRAMLLFDRGAVSFLLDGALGGIPADEAQELEEEGAPKQLTSPQRAVMNRLADALLKAISEALGSLGVRLRRLPPSSGTPPEGQFAAITFLLGEGSSRKIVVAVARDALQNAGLGLFSESKQKDTIQNKVPAVLQEVELELVVELGRIRRKLADIDSLKVGDTLRLGVPVRSPVTIQVQGQPMFRGKPTTVGTQLAVSIVERATLWSPPTVVAEDAKIESTLP